MKNLIYLVLLASNCIVAQITFEKGYFIDNAGQRNECLIKNEDWVNNPTRFYFKANEESPENIRTIQNVKEFGVDIFSKYERHEVLIDTSEVDVSKLKSNKNPEWSKKTLFLKLIVDGDAKLYEYVDGMHRKYFYSFKGSSIEQLVFKEYFKFGNQILLVNNSFHQQLWNNVKCSSTEKGRISRIRYKSQDLVKYFLEVNNCDGNRAVTTENTVKTNHGFTSIKIKGGVNFSKLKLESETNSVLFPVAFDNKVGFKIGAEIQQTLGFNKNKWAIFYEPTYQTYSSNATRKIVLNHIENEFKWNVKYNCLDHYLGFKHFMFLKNESKLFLSGGVIFKQPVGKNEMNMKGDVVTEYKFDTRFNFALSFGYSFKKSELEMRYGQPDILNNSKLNSNLNTFSVIYAHTIFDFKKHK